MLILGQKSCFLGPTIFHNRTDITSTLFLTLKLGLPQPTDVFRLKAVIVTLWSKTFCWTKALQFLWSDFYWLSQSLIFLCCNFYFLFFLQKKLLLFFVLMQLDWARHYLDPWELCWNICISPILLFSLALDQAHLWYLTLF